MRILLNKFPPSVVALLLQFAAVLLAAESMHVLGWHAAPWVFGLSCGLLAAGMSYVAGLAKWWWLIQLSFVPALLLALHIGLPPGFYLVVFLLLLLVYWSTFRTQVPLYLSSNKVWSALEELLPATQADTRFSFVDLGSGLGGVLTHLAKVRADGIYTGVESAPFPFLWSWLRIKLGGYRNCHVRWGSLWDCDLSQYDVVFAYLSPVPMAELWHKARSEMRTGSLFISSTFNVHDQAPQATIQIDDMHRSILYVWRM